MGERRIYRAQVQAAKRTKDGREIVLKQPVTAYGDSPSEASAKLRAKMKRQRLHYVGSIIHSEA